MHRRELLKNQADCFLGEDFHESIKDPFVFKDETVGCRHSKKTKVVKLPPFVPPRKPRARVRLRSALKTWPPLSMVQTLAWMRARHPGHSG